MSHVWAAMEIYTKEYDSRFKIFIDQFGPNEGHVNIHRYVYMTKIQMVKNEQDQQWYDKVFQN